MTPCRFIFHQATRLWKLGIGHPTGRGQAIVAAASDVTDLQGTWESSRNDEDDEENPGW